MLNTIAQSAAAEPLPAILLAFMLAVGAIGGFVLDRLTDPRRLRRRASKRRAKRRKTKARHRARRRTFIHA